MWWPIPQLGSASPPLQPSLTTALLSKCQSEPPGLLCISILALVGLFIPCPRDADSLHSASAAAEFRVGWSTRVHLHRPFITSTRPSKEPAAAFLQELVVGDVWSHNKHFRNAQVEQHPPNLCTPWMQA